MTTMKKTSTKTTADKAVPPLDFETTLTELDEIVEKMENGELSLEASLEAFERGVKLTRTCQTTLKRAELRIQTLTEENQDLAPSDETREAAEE